MLLQEAFTPITKGLPSMVEVLKKQLTLSESTVQDLREQVHSLQTTVEQLTRENNELKHMLRVTDKKFYLDSILIYNNVICFITLITSLVSVNRAKNEFFI